MIHVDFSVLKKGRPPPLPKPFEVSEETKAVFAQLPPPPSPLPPCKCWDCTTGPMQVEPKRYPGLGLLFALLTGILAWSMLVYFFAKVLL